MSEHLLSRNGAPHDDEGNLTNKDPKITAGEGRGKCSCGRLSDVLPNGASRRRWHKWHKENETSDEAVQEETPMEENIEEEAAAETPVAEAEATEEEEAVEPDNTGEIKEHKFTVPFTRSLAKHFWIPAGVKGTREFLALNFPGVASKADHSKFSIRLTGPDALDVATAAEAIQEMWEAAAVDFKTWKKTDADYQSLNHTVKADRSKSYVMTRDWFVTFCKNYEF